MNEQLIYDMILFVTWALCPVCFENDVPLHSLSMHEHLLEGVENDATINSRNHKRAAPH